MTTETVTCDVCGAVKGATNHWYLLRLTGDDEGVVIEPHSTQKLSGDLDVCGKPCAIKKISERLK